MFLHFLRFRSLNCFCQGMLYGYRREQMQILGKGVPDSKEDTMLGYVTTTDEFILFVTTLICVVRLTACVPLYRTDSIWTLGAVLYTCSGENDVIASKLFWKGMDSGFFIIGWRHRGGSDEARFLTLQQFDWLMSGLEIEQPKAF